ncbi:MAG TPA: hypothetical protein VL988_01935 [Solirubrobacteraceae bacterium]|nr:hypothetical protein [Solirubrobacteraceae bacterium]
MAGAPIGAQRALSRPRPSRGRRTGASAKGLRFDAGAIPRIRWDRLGRLAMLFVLAALLYLYLSAGIRMLSTWHQSHHDRATVAAMEREHTALVRQREALGRQGSAETQARKLGMAKPDERPYVITGLPAN